MKINHEENNENQPRRNEEHEASFCSFFVFFVSSWLIFGGENYDYLFTT